MALTSLLALCQGLAFFLYGTSTLSSALRRMAGIRLRPVLKRTSGRVQGLFIGAGITVLLQSSSALTVLLVRLVDAGLLELRQGIGVIMGSNIGTTLTPWLLALTGMNHDSLPLALFQPQYLIPVLSLTGVFLTMSAPTLSIQNTGHMLVGFSLLFWSMDQMTQAVSPLAESHPGFLWLSTSQNALFGLLVGTVFTAVIQSSAASIGILQALVLTHPISYASAIPIILGQNIGTCVTACLSAIGASRKAKQVAVIHVFFNLIGALCGLIFLSVCSGTLHLSWLSTPITPFGIALCHTLFNLGTTLLLLPFPDQLELLADSLVPERIGSHAECFS